MFGLVLAAIVFVTKLAGPDRSSEWPPLVDAAASAVVAFIWVWLFIPIVAYVGYLILTLVRIALRPARRPAPSRSLAQEERRSSGDISAR